ncbi:MAG: alpha/beta hydrolase [Solirubrobacteraceae bacterium]|nr:alpha/beta hydrolase [Solirubrobacteraceae bacterium]
MTFGAASAGAVSGWQPCVYAEIAYDCATFEMPLDRTGAVPGTTTVRATRLDASEGPRMGTIFVIAGGPGQTAQVMLGLMADAFGGANRYDVVAVDQRGSGSSEPLNCPRIESANFDWVPGDPADDRPFTDCSISLGAARASYNTAEAVADLEAVRVSLGVEKASFFGVSYGTKVALAYAQAHPDHTKALLIDSVLPTDMPGQFDIDSIAASRGALRRICSGNRCHGIGNSPVTNMASLATRLERRPLETFLVAPTGRVSEEKIDALALNDILFAADMNPFIYNQIPGMLTESLRGNTAQLERLYAIVNGAVGASDSYAGARRLAAIAPKRTKVPATRKVGDRVIGRDAESLAMFSSTMFFATTCADFLPPWPRSTDVSNRQAKIVAAANAIPSSQFYPFSRTTGRDNSTSSYCRGWQQDPTPPAIVQGPLPNVPTLALDGNLDLRTPVSWAERAVSGNPSAELVKIPNTGHSVIGTDISGCALSLAKRFLIFGATDGKCSETAPAIPIAPRPVASLQRVRTPAGTCRGIRGRSCTNAKRALAAGYLAMRDTLDQLLIGGMDTGNGLLGGVWGVEYDLGDDLSLIPIDLNMEGVSNVPGVYTSGKLNLEQAPAVNDTLRMGGWRVLVSGRVAYDRAGDSLTLAGRRGRARVTVRLRPSGSRAAVAHVTAKQLKLRRNYALAANPPAGTLGR